MYIVSTNQVVCMITHIRSGLININYRSTRINDPVGPMSCVFLQLLFQVPQKFPFACIGQACLEEKKLYMRRRYQETCYRPVQVFEPGAMKNILLVITSQNQFRQQGLPKSSAAVQPVHQVRSLYKGLQKCNQGPQRRH